MEQKNKQLRAQLARAETERDILKSVDHLFITDGPIKRFAFIALHAACWPVRQQCQLLGVSPSGYYAWRKRVSASATEPALPARQVAARRVFTAQAGRYSQRRLRTRLRREGYEMGRQHLRICLIGSILYPSCTRVSSRPRTTQADLQAVAAANKLAT